MESPRARQMRLKREQARGQHTSPRRAYEQLRASIRAGVMENSLRIAEEPLARSLGASRNSVRRALQMLADEGLIVRERGVGTAVSSPIRLVPAAELLPCGWQDLAGPDGVAVEELRTDLVTCPPDASAHWGITAATLFLYEQMGMLAGEPSYVRIAYIPVEDAAETPFERIAALDRELRGFDECFRLIFEAEPGASESTIEAAPCTRRIAYMLRIPQGAPVLMRELVLRDASGAVREVSYTHFRGDRVALAYDSVDAGLHLRTQRIRSEPDGVD